MDKLQPERMLKTERFLYFCVTKRQLLRNKGKKLLQGKRMEEIEFRQEVVRVRPKLLFVARRYHPTATGPKMPFRKP